MTLLNIDTIKNIAQKVLPKDCTFEIWKSQTSESIYLAIRYNTLDTTIRFSDHKTSKSSVKTIIIEEKTKVKLIERTINKTVTDLKALSLSISLGITKYNK